MLLDAIPTDLIFLVVSGFVNIFVNGSVPVQRVAAITVPLIT
jgi:hypothetical protein